MHCSMVMCMVLVLCSCCTRARAGITFPVARDLRHGQNLWSRYINHSPRTISRLYALNRQIVEIPLRPPRLSLGSLHSRGGGGGGGLSTAWLMGVGGVTCKPRKRVQSEAAAAATATAGAAAASSHPEPPLAAILPPPPSPILNHIPRRVSRGRCPDSSPEPRRLAGPSPGPSASYAARASCAVRRQALHARPPTRPDPGCPCAAESPRYRPPSPAQPRVPQITGRRAYCRAPVRLLDRLLSSWSVSARLPRLLASSSVGERGALPRV